MYPHPSPCTSRNLNLNSFCNLTDDASLAKWKPAIQATYENISKSPRYIRELSGPMRLVHPDWMAEKELITSLIKVLIHQVVVLEQFHFSFQGEYYNAFEKDIAVVNIFFGKSTVFGKVLFSHGRFANLTLRYFR